MTDFLAIDAIVTGILESENSTKQELLVWQLQVDVR